MARSSVRRVAAVVGITFQTLAEFLNGARPQPRTRRKILDYYARNVEAHGPGNRDAALHLLRSIPATTRRDAERELAAMLATLHEKYGASPPSWDIPD